MIGSIRQGVFIILSAPSGCGKTTIKNRLMQTQQFLFSVSYTTRKPRSGEVDGQDYRFVSPEQFAQKVDAGEFLEHANVHGCLYGTGVESLDPIQDGHTVLLDIDVQGHTQLKQRYPESVSVFILPPSWSTLKDRLQGRRTESDSDLERRLAAAQKELEHYHDYDYVVVNDQLDHCIETILAIVAAERHKTKRWEVDVHAFYKS